MTGSQDSNEDQSTTFGPSDDAPRVRATSASARHTATFDRPQAAVTTAEIPVIRSNRQGSAPVRYASQRSNVRSQSWSARPDAAPAPVRLLVWTLLFIFILLLVGFVAVLAHPAWLSFIRNTTTAPQALAALHGLNAQILVH